MSSQQAFLAYIQSLQNRRETMYRETQRQAQERAQIIGGVAGRILPAIAEQKQQEEKTKYIYDITGTYAPEKIPTPTLPEEERIGALKSQLEKRRAMLTADIDKLQSLVTKSGAQEPKPGRRNRIISEIDKKQAESDRLSRQLAGQNIGLEQYRGTEEYKKEIDRRKMDAFFKQNPMYSRTYYEAYDKYKQMMARDPLKEWAEKKRLTEGMNLPQKKKSYVDSLLKTTDDLKKTVFDEGISDEILALAGKYQDEINNSSDIASVDRIYGDALIELRKLAEKETPEKKKEGFFARLKRQSVERKAEKEKTRKSQLEQKALEQKAIKDFGDALRQKQ
jgi:hypothetical protein